MLLCLLIIYTYICIFIYMRSVILYITYMYMYIHVCTYFDFPPPLSLPPPFAALFLQRTSILCVHTRQALHFARTQLHVRLFSFHITIFLGSMWFLNLFFFSFFFFITNFSSSLFRSLFFFSFLRISRHSHLIHSQILLFPFSFTDYLYVY